jgi:Zn-dependent peptidase ImmA (M78 family)
LSVQDYNIDQIIEAVRDMHPELRRPATWNAMRRAFKREGITLMLLPLTADAKLISMGGVSVMAVRSDAPPARHTYFAVHEYAHVRLHAPAADEVVFNMSPCWPNDPREDEAEYFAQRLMQGW